MLDYDDTVAFYDKLVATCPTIERKGKTMPYTSDNGYMYSLVNKEGEIGIRLPKKDGEQFMIDHGTTRFKSHGAFMRDYVLIPESLYSNMKLLTTTLQESQMHVQALKPK